MRRSPPFHRHRSIHRSFLAAALACVASAAFGAADVAAAGVQVVPEAEDWVYWTHNGRTYRLPAIRLDSGDNADAPVARGGLANAPSGLALPSKAVAAKPAPTGFSGLTILIGGIVLSVMAGIGAAWGIRRRMAWKEADKTVLVTATGLIVSIDESKKGTGLITLNRRDRSSAIYRAADPAIAAAVAEAGDGDLPPNDDEVGVEDAPVADPNAEFNDGAAEFDEASVEPVADAAVDNGISDMSEITEDAEAAPVAEASAEDEESVFEVVEGDDGDSDVRVVSDRIREKHRLNGTRRYIAEES